MTSRITILPEAVKDGQEAFRWYEERQSGLGKRFLEAVDKCLTFIQNHPKASQVVRGDYRRVVVQKFPYVVFYEYDEASEMIVVYSIFHTSQDPEKWQKRLP